VRGAALETLQDEHIEGAVQLIGVGTRLDH
jgi:hypothetical protein